VKHLALLFERLALQGKVSEFELLGRADARLQY
jgi:hypothetical protein